MQGNYLRGGITVFSGKTEFISSKENGTFASTGKEDSLEFSVLSFIRVFPYVPIPIFRIPFLPS